MDSIKATAFFSRPFDPRIQKTVETIEAICRGIDVKTVCVDRPDPDVPSQNANALIKSADFLIALCSRVHKIDGHDKYLTSTAVREEIAIAQAMGKKIAFFFEGGVEADGFARNIATSKNLENFEVLTPNDIENIVIGIHSTKLRAVSSTDDVFHATVVKNFHIPKLESKL